MANTDLLIPIVVAVIGLLGSALSLFLSWRTERRTHKRQMANLTEKYAQPLLVASYDLQQRLYELVECPISRQHLSTEEGRDDLKIYTCYLLAQYLALAYILRTKTGYLSFTTERKLKKLRKIMYLIDEELDRRRNPTLMNVGVWPAARTLVAERMIVKGDDLNDALDGGFGVEVKGFDQFHNEWDKKFRQPMGYFCNWIDMMLEGRLVNQQRDAPMRCLQHLVVDLVNFLDRNRAYMPKGREALKCKKSDRYCDCAGEGCQDGGDLDSALKFRQTSRLGDAGLWPVGGHHADRRSGYNSALDRQISLEEVEKMTYTINLD